jgi:hypothetical protein
MQGFSLLLAGQWLQQLIMHVELWMTDCAPQSLRLLPSERSISSPKIELCWYY